MSCISLFLPRNLSRIVAAGVVSGLFAFGPPTSTAGRIDLGSLLEQVIDRRVVVESPEPAFVCRQVSSYNRNSVTPDRPDLDSNGKLIGRTGQALLRPENDRLNITRTVGGAVQTPNPGQSFRRKDY